MHYEIKKSENEKAPWVLFIHGLGGSIATWKYQMNDFSKFNILCIDLQGHGKSDFDKYDKVNPSIAAADDIEIVMKVEGIESVNIVALSLGTLVALEFLKRYPEKVRSMVMGGCVINLNAGKQMLLALVQGLKHIMPVKVLYPLFANIMMPRKNHKKSRDIFVRESLKLTQEAFKAWVNMLHISRQRMREYFNLINIKRIPILFITGREDYLFISGIQKLSNSINSFRLELIEKCGHVCSIEKHDIFDRLALDFLQSENAM